MILDICFNLASVFLFALACVYFCLYRPSGWLMISSGMFLLGLQQILDCLVKIQVDFGMRFFGRLGIILVVLYDSISGVTGVLLLGFGFFVLTKAKNKSDETGIPLRHEVRPKV